jgi:hypothetical protein
MNSMAYRLKIERWPEGRSEFVSSRNAVGIDAKVLNELATLFGRWAALPFAGAANAECS